MSREEAEEIARPFFASFNSVAVQSDGVIYLNADLDAAENHAVEYNLELFIIKK